MDAFFTHGDAVGPGFGMAGSTAGAGVANVVGAIANATVAGRDGFLSS